MNRKKVTVLGAGISGLATAYWLHKNGIEIQILEANNEPGGSMITDFEEEFLIDYGPNSGLETTPLIKKIVEEIGLEDEMIYASESSNKRYILRDGKLHALPMSAIPFLTTKLFSVRGKLRLLCEPLIGKSDDGYYQTIAEFVKRRLGKEFLDYAIDPFVSGVFAGDPSKLSVKSAFPKLYRLEELYGGLVKGMIKGARERKQRSEQSKQSAKMFSFKSGMQILPRTIANKLNNVIEYNSNVKKVEHVFNKTDGKWKVIYEKDNVRHEIFSDCVLSTVPAYTAANIFNEMDEKLTQHLKDIFYPSVLVLYIGFYKKDIGLPLDGFGFLIPSKENKKFLGAIWSSTIFSNRASEEKASFTLFIGGAQTNEIRESDKENIIDNVLSEFKQIMKINSDPIFMREKLWMKAIPQYNIGYIEHENYFDKFEKNFPGLILSGNYRGGISVGDCIKNSEIVYKKILEN